jgi:hypothetical protein
MATDWVTQHLTGVNERRTLGVVSSATPEVNSDIYGALNITALAAAITGVTVTGSPNDLQELIVRITDNGVARAIAWGAQFVAMGVALPATTAPGLTMTNTFVYDASTDLWGLIASVEEV